MLLKDFLEAFPKPKEHDLLRLALGDVMGMPVVEFHIGEELIQLVAIGGVSGSKPEGE